MASSANRNAVRRVARRAARAVHEARLVERVRMALLAAARLICAGSCCCACLIERTAAAAVPDVPRDADAGITVLGKLLGDCSVRLSYERIVFCAGEVACCCCIACGESAADPKAAELTALLTRLPEDRHTACCCVVVDDSASSDLLSYQPVSAQRASGRS